ATGARDNTVKLWDAQIGQKLKDLGQADQLRHLAFSSDGERLVTGSVEGAVKIWDVTSGQELMILHKHANEVTSIVFSRDGTRLASSGGGGVVKMWKMAEP